MSVRVAAGSRHALLGVVAGTVLALSALAGCSAGSDVGGPVCAAYLRYNDAIAEAHDVADLRDATVTLRDALPRSGEDPSVAKAAADLDVAAASGSKDPATYLQAASAVADICDFGRQ